jgi:hypothetical protein
MRITSHVFVCIFFSMLSLLWFFLVEAIKMFLLDSGKDTFHLDLTLFIVFLVWFCSALVCLLRRIVRRSSGLESAVCCGAFVLGASLSFLLRDRLTLLADTVFVWTYQDRLLKEAAQNDESQVILKEYSSYNHHKLIVYDKASVSNGMHLAPHMDRGVGDKSGGFAGCEIDTKRLWGGFYALNIYC